MTAHTVASQFATDLTDAVARVAASLFLTTGHGHRATTVTAIGATHAVASDHLLPHADRVTLTRLDGTETEATIVGRDRLTDLALLATTEPLQPLPLSAAAPRPGQLVVAAGLSWNGLVAHPGWITSLSGPHETRTGLRLEQLIGTSLSPFSGFSGGPLVDANGALLGIASSAIVKGSGRAVPARDVLRVVELLKTGGARKRGYLGISTVAVALPPGQQAGGHVQGLLVVSLAEDGPAAPSGLLVGDVLVTAGGTPVSRTRDLLGVVRDAPIGASLTAEVIRGTSLTTIALTVGERPARAD